MRPSPFTENPALITLYFSRERVGLWSVESGTALPAMAATQRESPALAQKTMPSLMNTVMAVHPLFSIISKGV
jgi:hypothetical protein